MTWGKRGQDIHVSEMYVALEILIASLRSVCDAHFRDRTGTQRGGVLGLKPHSSQDLNSSTSGLKACARPTRSPTVYCESSRAGAPDPGPWSGTCPGPVRNWAAPQGLSSPWASERHLPLPITHITAWTNPTPQSVKNCLPWNRSLVPKMLGTTPLGHSVPLEAFF